MQSDDNSSDDPLLRLLQRSGRRELPPDDVTRQVYEHAWGVWQAAVRRRRWWNSGWKIAASLVLAVVVSLWWRANSVAPEFALLEAGTDVQVFGARRTLPWEATDSRLRVGGAIVTGSVGARIRRGDGLGMLLGSDTRLRVASMTSIVLEYGRIYVDTGPDSAAVQPLVVSTVYGSVGHVGTQFQVDLSHGEFALAVREGRVVMTTPGSAKQGTAKTARQLTLESGQALQIDRAGRAHRLQLGPFDAGWLWADALARPISIDGRSLDAVLAEVAARSGLSLSYASDAAASQAHRVVLHGPDLLLSPRIALDAALAGTRLAFVIQDRALVIQER